MNIIWEVTPNGITKKYHPDIEEETESPQRPSSPWTLMSNLSQGDEIIASVYFDQAGKEIRYTITRFGDREHPEYYKHIISRMSGARRAVRSERIEEQRNRAHYVPSIGWVRVCRTLDIWFKKSPWCLMTFSARGDTLCRFVNYNQATSVTASAGKTTEGITTYFYNDRLTFRTDYSDTVFRVTAPNRILPVYAMNTGKYKLFATEGLKGQIENKLYIERIRETQRFLFVSINTPKREKQVLVFDKQQQTLRLHKNENFANDIDNGPVFYPEKIMPDGKTVACSYRSDYFQKNPSTVISSLFPSMANNSAVFMIVQ